MSIWIDRKYLLLLSPKLQQFKQKNTNLYTFRCPYCGDSHKIKTKTRGFVYSKNTNYFFTCFNCGYGTTLRNLIGLLDPYLEKEYVMENFQETSGSTERKFEPIVKPNIPIFKTVDKRLDIPTISELCDSHSAKKYLIGRKIPETSFKFLYYAEDFKSFVESVSDTRLDKTSSRIVIPFFASDGRLIAFQGRALDSYSMRYITIKVDPNSPKIFGLDRIDPSKTIYVCEGPLDSLFVPNCLATADANLSVVGNLYSKDNLILIPDNEPRSKPIVNNISRYISGGYTVCLFPDSFGVKDINDAVKNGLTISELCDIIAAHTYTGLRAELEFMNWRKV
jgi:transcription elongation factor Elf1